MSARDKIHYAVRNALEKNGWTVTADPLALEFKEVKTEIDLAAERLLALERGGEKIAVEIKSFRSRSTQYELHTAVGQFVMYSTFLKHVEPDRVLFVAIPDVVYSELFSIRGIERLRSENGIRLIVVDVENEEIVQWIT